MSSTTWFRAAARSPRTGEIAIFSDIGPPPADVASFAATLKNLGPVSTIEIQISSNGGDVSTGLAIYNMLKAHPARKVVTVIGLAASMASAIAMAGDEIIMPGNALLMLHNPFGEAFGTAAEIRSFSSGLTGMQEALQGIYMARTGLPLAKIAQMMDSETWLTAKQAVELGFADRVADSMRAAASVDTSRFKHPPRTLENMAAEIYANYNLRGSYRRG